MKKICGALFLVLSLATCFVALAQTKKTAKPEKKQEEKKQDNLNKTDAQNRKQGLWFYKHDARLGEPLYYEFGSYEDNLKTGVWTRLDSEHRLIATENFYRGVLNGTSQYYEDGKLVCIGNYRGLYATSKYDSIWVTDPVTDQDTLVAVPTEWGYTKHGLWRYYDATTGQLTKEEEYQVDDLIYEKEFPTTTAADSLRWKRRNDNLPHNKNVYAKPPAGKRKSLIY